MRARWVALPERDLKFRKPELLLWAVGLSDLCPGGCHDHYYPGQ